MEVKLISVTPNAEQTIGYCARVSNPSNQDNPDVSKLLAYCIKHGHWSIFEMANMVVEIKTSRGISAQILRHRSFSFQEFSQRYAKVDSFEPVEVRAQDVKNRQNSLDNLTEDVKIWFEAQYKEYLKISNTLYDEALSKGIAKECARFVLPMSSSTKLYMNGTIRSWIHYLNLRTTPGTQKEHRDIANAIKVLFCEQFPIIALALEWIKREDIPNLNTQPNRDMLGPGSLVVCAKV